jgi:hypothetical protein
MKLRTVSLKLKTVSLVFVLSLGLLGFNAFSANAKKSQTPAPNAPAKASEAELVERFNQVLDKALSDTNVCVSTDAARRLNDLVKTAAANIVRGKEFKRVPEAEKNIGTLADALIKLGDKSSDGHVRIMPNTIEHALERHDNIQVAPPREGDPVPPPPGLSICPLFPFC